MRCPGCGEENPTRAKFCLECGARLTAPASPALRSAAPEAYTPAHLAEKILTSRAAVEGERKQVTVLFADLKGSMELLADRDPEEARKILDPVLEMMMDAVHRYEGTVNQVMGDGIMALFGAPVAHEDHAIRACYAALRMQETITAYGDETQRRHGLPVQIRVGLNSGEVVVRAINSDLHMDYTAVGQTTHLAARMEQMAKPGSILATANTARLAEGYVDVRSLGPMMVKGLDAPVDAYRVTGVGAVHSRLGVSAARGLTRFVGRQAELDTLSAALDRAVRELGHAVGVVGEAGVGKSRLFWEFTHSPRTQGCLVVDARSVAYGRATPYAPLIELLRVYFKIDSRDDVRRIREKVTGKVLALDRALEDALPALFALLDVAFDDVEWQELEPAERRQRILNGIRRIFLRESQVQPVIFVIEDLHWIDPESQALLDSVMERRLTPLLLLLNFRPEYRHGWGGQPKYTELRLEPLAQASATELLAALLGDDASLSDLKRLLIERTGGNPFFLEESVRTLVETGALDGDRGAYRLVAGLPSVQVPATVQAILAARIDRLPLPEKRLLQAASVVGRDVPDALLQAIAEESEEAFRRALSHLQTAEFLYESNLFPDLEYSFKHALTHEVAYGSLLHDRRRALHARIVETMERTCGDRLAEQTDRLAHHAFQGELWDQALGYLREAAAKAAGRSAYHDAAARLEQALVALAHVPDSGESRELAIDLRIELRHSLMPLGDHRRILQRLHEAETLAVELDDERRLASIWAFMANAFYVVGDYERALAAALRSHGLATRLDDVLLQITASFYVTQAYHGLGEYRRALKHIRWAVEALERHAIPFDMGAPPGRGGRLHVTCHQWLILCLLEVGEFAEGVREAEQALARAERLNRAEVTIGVSFSALLFIRKGEIERALAILDRAYAACETVDIPMATALIASQLGYGLALAGRAAEAVPVLEGAMDGVAAFGMAEARTATWLAEAYLLAGRIEEATARAAQALELARQRREHGTEAWALRLLGEVTATRSGDEFKEAEAFYLQALALADELDMRPLVAHCHLGLGMLHRRTGKAASAERHLATAQALFSEMDMRPALE